MDVNSNILELMNTYDEAIAYLEQIGDIDYDILQALIEGLYKTTDLLSENETFNEINEEFNFELEKMVNLVEIKDVKSFCDIYKFKIKELILECLD